MDSYEKVADFVKYFGIACGGNWSQMLMSAIKNGLPEVYSKLRDREYTFSELWNILDRHVN